MPRIKALIKSVCHRIAAIPMNVSKRMYRNSAIIVMGAIVLSVVSFTSTGFGASGKNAVIINNGIATAGIGLKLDASIDDDLLESQTSLLMTLDIRTIESCKLAVGRQLSEETLDRKAKSIAAKATALRVKSELETVRAAKEAAAEQERIKQQRCQILGIDSFTEDDYSNLLRIVQSEAGVLDMESKIIVANVIINRVKNSKFPSTVSEVIFSSHQFSPVSNGTFYSCSITNQTQEAVERVLSGEDNSHGALYFMNRGASRSSSVSWFDNSLTFLFARGSHEYFK